MWRACVIYLLCGPAWADEPTPWWEQCEPVSAFAALAYSAAWRHHLPEDRFIIERELHEPADYAARIAIKHEAYHAPQALRLRVQMVCAEKQGS